VTISNKMTAPYQAMAASDGHFVMGANNQKLWVQLCTLMKRTELLEDPRFSTISLRLGNRPALQDELENTFRTQPKDFWVELLLANGIPAGPIIGYPEAFASDHAQARNMRMEIDHPVEGKVPNIGFAVKLSGTPPQVRRHPPLLGEHTAEVLAEIGIDAAEHDKLRAAGAFAE
jgi:formyl-CoA transferase